MKQIKISKNVTEYIMDNRTDWLSMRKRIGGSDAAAIIGKNPWLTNQELWEIKTGRYQPSSDLSDNEAVQYGVNAEPHVRALFALDYPNWQVKYDANNLFTNTIYPFAHGSLDGWIIDENSRNGILEIKTSTISTALQAAKWKDQIPDNYFVQVLWYLMVTEFDFVVLRGYLRHDFGNEVYSTVRDYKIERSDVEDDIQYLTEKAAEFWKCVEEKRKPNLILPEI